MLQVINSINDRRKSQRQLREMLQGLPSQGKHKVGFRGGAITLPLYGHGNGKLWYAHQALTEVPTPRHWNAFGLFDPDKTIQFITVEINIPTAKKENGVAGFFARDVETGETYLMHTGRVGGGRPGIGQGKFLAWSMRSPEEVIDGEDKYRLGLIVSPLDKRVIAERISHFVQQVAAFKEAAVAGELDTPDFRRRVEEIEKFNREFSGRKRGRRKGGKIDYISYHGDIVNALFEKRSAECGPDEKVFNSQPIDLYVRRKGQIVAVYEVKPEPHRQALYTAIGQLMVHSQCGADVQKTLVIPADEQLPEDVATALIAADIEVLGFERETGGTISFTNIIPGQAPTTISKSR